MKVKKQKEDVKSWDTKVKKKSGETKRKKKAWNIYVAIFTLTFFSLFFSLFFSSIPPYFSLLYPLPSPLLFSLYFFLAPYFSLLYLPLFFPIFLSSPPYFFLVYPPFLLKLFSPLLLSWQNQPPTFQTNIFPEKFSHMRHTSPSPRHASPLLLFFSSYFRPYFSLPEIAFFFRGVGARQIFWKVKTEILARRFWYAIFGTLLLPWFQNTGTCPYKTHMRRMSARGSIFFFTTNVKKRKFP